MTTKRNELSLRPEETDDREFCTELFASARAMLFEALPLDMRTKVLQQQFAAQTAFFQHTFPGARYDIVEADRERVGRLVVAAGAADIRLVDISILPAWRRQGLGTSIIHSLQREAMTTSRAVTLTVATNNLDAIRLYERLAFRAVEPSDMYVAMRWSADTGDGQPSGARQRRI